MPIRLLHGVGSALDDLREFPSEARRNIGYALHFAQAGDKHPSAKPLRGFGGASLLEVVEDYDSEAYRAVYTVRFAEAIYVLHCFKKKSKRGIETPKHEIDLIKTRLKRAEEHYELWQQSKKTKN
jgi:phage-related protein